MGYSCSSAALRTLGAIKAVMGAECATSNEIMVSVRYNSSCVLSPAKAFFEKGRENADGAITGKVIFCEPDPSRMRKRDVVPFKINADGTIGRFPGISGRIAMEIGRKVRDPNFREPMGVI